MQMLNDGCEFFGGRFHLAQGLFPFRLEFPVSGVSGYAGPIRQSIVELLGNLVQSRTLFD